MSNINTRKALFTFGLGAFGKVAELISKTDYLPQKPSQLLKLLRLVSSDKASHVEIAGEIAKDKELVAKVLNLKDLNSNYQNLNQEDYQNAIKNLEKNFLQSIIEIQAAKKYHYALTHQNLSGSAHYKLVQSVKSAVIAKAVAQWVNFPHTEIAFMSALLQDLPEAVLNINDAESYRKVQVKLEDGMNEQEAYLVEFGFDKSAFGSKLFKYYSMPSVMVEVMQHGFRSSKIAKTEPKQLAKIVNFSRFIADCFADKTQSPSSIWNESQQAIQELGMSISSEEWGNKISLLFVKSIEFEMSVSS